MTGVSDADIERAEARVAAERDQALARIGATLSRPGSGACEICGDEISPARRAAYPAARDCIECARAKEGQAWKR